MKALRALSAPLTQSPHRRSWVIGLVTGFVLAVTGSIAVGVVLTLFAPPIIAIFIGTYTAKAPQFGGRPVRAAVGGMAVAAGIPIYIGSLLSYVAYYLLHPTPGFDLNEVVLVALFEGVVLVTPIYILDCGIAALAGAVLGRNNRPMPILPDIYDA